VEDRKLKNRFRNHRIKIVIEILNKTLKQLIWFGGGPKPKTWADAYVSGMEFSASDLQKAIPVDTAAEEFA
jgi:hypothetical protein